MAPIETRHRDFTPILRGLRADALDCVQANLAVLADQRHGAGAHLALGSALRFPTDSSAGARLAEAEELAGLRVVDRWDDVDGDRLIQLSLLRPTLYVVADAYTLPWVPYAGHEHMEHTFLLVNSASPTVIDAYHNDTQWGPARPGAWKLTTSEFTAAVPRATAYALDVQPVKLDPVAVLTTNAAEMSAAIPAIERYADAATADLPRLVLDVWLFGRSRLLHAAWLASAGLPSEAAERQAQDWLSFAGQTYVAMRRAERGGSPPTPIDADLRRLLRADVELAETLADDLVREAVTEALCAVLHIAGTEIQDSRPLRELPGYNSFRLVDVINRVEDRLGLQLDPGALTAENLRDPGSLRHLFTTRRA